ncbi:hypothetical protein SNE40_021429 [Patella caerulea]|uniref:Solute carrier organic anion transporter family member n=2 Tax=Patella caerulea TaxID=87958 RepID=A0AAN8J499_PATCE
MDKKGRNGEYSPPAEQNTDDPDTECGMGSCKPNKLKCCATMGCFTAVYGLSGLVTSSLQIYINSQITTIERQFGFSSSVSGLILSSNDIGYLLTTLFMSYIARKTHIPRVLALSTMFFGFSGLICSIPHFMDMDSFRLSHREGNITTMIASPLQGGSLCLNDTFSGMNDTLLHCGTTENINKNATIRTVAILLLSVGMCLQGFGKSPRYPFLATYVDDNVEQTQTPLYLGIISSVGIFGPALGFTLGGVFSKMYVTLEETNMSLRDPRWIGAWWLGFLFFGSIGVIAGIPLLCFPRKMRSRPKHLDNLKTKKAVKSNNKCEELKGLLKSTFRLLSSPIYMCCSLSTCVVLFSISGMLAFLPKYLESHFHIPTWKANILLGTVNVFGAASGALAGGLLTSKLKLTPMTCLKLVTGITFFSSFIIATGFFITCPKPEINQGLSRTYITTKEYNTTQCDIDLCGCDNERYFPVCGSDNQNYFSPCHAGCTTNDNMLFTNCSCIEDEKSTAQPGLCVGECPLIWPYVAFNFVGAFVSTMIILPNFVISVRSIKESDKPLGIGMSAFLATLLGWFPGPVVYGKIIDTTCLIWSDTCTGKGACSMYDIDDLRVKYHTLFIGARSVATLFYVVALIIALKKKQPFFVDRKDDPAEMETMIVKKNDILKTKGTKV